MLPRCDQHSPKERLSELRVALVVVRMKSFFNPLQLVGLQSLRKLLYKKAVCMIYAIIIYSYIPYMRKYWRAFNLAIFAVEPPTKILAVLNLAIFPYA